MWSKLTDIFNFNSSTLSGVLDVIVVEDKNHVKNSTAFHFRVGKFKVFMPDQREVDLYVNGQLMKTSVKLSQRGVGYFEVEVDPVELNNSQFSENLLLEEELFHEMKNPNLGEIAKDKLIKDRNKKADNQPEQERDIEIDRLVLDDHNPDNNSKDGLIVADDSKPEHNQAHSDSLPSKMKLKDGENLIKDAPSKTREAAFAIPGTQIELSLCARYLEPDMSPKAINDIFYRHKVSFLKFNSNPHIILSHKDLMIRIDNIVYESHIGVPQILSVLAFNKGLTEETLVRMAEEQEAQNPRAIKEGRKEKILRRSLKPDSKILDSFGLKEGINELAYKFKGNFGKVHTFYTRIFYYKYRPQFRVVVSDIDGTITRSDVLGHLMPMANQDWNHRGIAELYTHLAERGYIMIYLSARNIGTADKTVSYLQSVKEKNYRMPDGPIITSPSTLYEALKREIIIKNPEVFKVHVLRNLKNLFGNGDYNPIFAGFGNKDSDAISYRVISIPRHYIFTIAPAGDIYMIKSKKTYSYRRINRLIDDLFPKFDSSQPVTFDQQDEFCPKEQYMLSCVSNESDENVHQ